MEQKRISMLDIVIGEPLPWDVYDLGQHLLLRKGHIVERPQQVESLIARGMFVDAKAIRGRADNPPPVKPQDKPSVVRFINLANRRLERLLLGLHTETEAQAKILEVGKVITFAADLNVDIALACILLNQGAGNYAIRHSIDTALVSLLIARAMKKTPEESQKIVAAALTMNVGMLRQQEQLQNKEDPLSTKEIDIIRTHPAEGVSMLKQAGIVDADWLSYVLLHHENEDGTGYPLGKSYQEIPENAKILAIADRYCARISARNYRKSLLPNAALRDILLADKKTIDPTLAACFIKELGIYPTGTYVRLQNGEIGIVTSKGKTTTTPIAHSLVGPRGAPLSFPIKRDTSKELFSIREVLHEDQAAVRVSMQQLWGEEAAQ
jgi:HD-GYP domain-containing protein (c-di-GMP phosphodiesterase class II)